MAGWSPPSGACCRLRIDVCSRRFKRGNHDSLKERDGIGFHIAWVRGGFLLSRHSVSKFLTGVAHWNLHAIAIGTAKKLTGVNIPGRIECGDGEIRTRNAVQPPG